MTERNDNSAQTLRQKILSGVPLAPLTTLDLGGEARYLVKVDTIETASEALRWARQEDLPVAIVGGGSNLVVADGGWPGIVLHVALQGISTGESGAEVKLTAAAGEEWDALVERTVEEDLAGLECLSGIPGRVGATPIQNVGAYGQDVASVIDMVQVLDLTDLSVRSLRAAECGFGYRTSFFRERPGRYLVLTVCYRLRRGGAPSIKYRELQKMLDARSASASLAETRDAVLELRRAKSMVIDSDDPNSRSVGSFFINPVVDDAALAMIQGDLPTEEIVPTFEMRKGQHKIPAAWLIEKAGFSKGERRGSVGISSAHALALIHYGGGSAGDLVAFAREIRQQVVERFGIELRPEPVFLGFDSPDPLG